MGTIQRQGIKNTFVTYFGIFLGFLSLIVVQPYFLSTQEVGLIRVLFSFSSLLAVFLPLGATSITIRYFPVFRNEQKNHHGFLGFILLFPLVGLILSFITLMLLKNFFIHQYEGNSKLFTEYFNYVLPFSFILGLINVLNTQSFSLFRTTVPSILNDVFARLGTMAVITCYFLKWISLDLFVLFFIVVSAVQLLLLVFYIFQIDKPGLRIDKAFLKTQHLPGIIGYGLLVSLASFSSIGLSTIPAVMIGKYLSLSLVGVYSISAYIPAIIEAPINSLEKISMTKISSALAINNMKEVGEIYFKSCRYLFLLGGLLFLGINCNIHAALQFLPPAYRGSEMVILLISFSGLLNVFSGANSSIIFSSKHYKFGTFLLFFIVLLCFVLNVLFIPMYGIEGAAASTLISVFVYSVMKFWFIRSKFNLMPYDRITFKIALIIAAVYAINLLIPSIPNSLADILMRSVIISIMYLTATYFLNIVPEFHSYIPFLKKTN